jgi:hypothetical protein
VSPVLVELEDELVHSARDVVAAVSKEGYFAWKVALFVHASRRSGAGSKSGLPSQFAQVVACANFSVCRPQVGYDR